jgi:hypothetical protein
MPETLEALERQRTKLHEQLQTLGDFRPGTISVNFRKCGKTNCACARKGHKGHGPPIPVEYHAEGTKPGAEFTYGSTVGKGP